MRSIGVMVHVSDCFRNQWKYGVGMYWGTAGANGRDRPQSAAIVMTSNKSSSCPGTNERKRVTRGESVYFGDGEYKVTLNNVYDTTTAHITVATDIPRPSSDPEPEDDFEFGGGETGGGDDGFGGDWADSTLPIGDVRTVYIKDPVGTEYQDGYIIEPATNIQNDGSAGDVYIQTGIGFIDSDNMIWMTGTPVKTQEYLSHNKIKTIYPFVQVEETDYHRQEGIGWFKKEQMYVFILAGHWGTSGVVWDDEMHKAISIYPTQTWTDPTKPGNWVDPDSVLGGLIGADKPWVDPGEEPKPEPESWWDLFKLWLEDIGFGKVIVKKPDLKEEAKNYVYGEIIK